MKTFKKQIFGFQKGESAADNVLESVGAILSNLKHDKNTVALFFDLAKDFHSISRKILVKMYF